MEVKRKSKNLQFFMYTGLVALFAVMVVVFAATSAHSSPHVAPIDGWTPTTALPQALASRNAIVHGDYLYVVGGKSASDAPIADVYVAQIQADGSLSNWANTGQLPTPVYLHAVVASDEHLYVVGGWDGSRTRSEIWRAPLLANGGVGSFVQIGELPQALDLHSALIVQEHLYVFGGWTGTQPLNTVYFAPLEADGIGTWLTGPSLPLTLYRLAAASDGRHIYITGGFDNSVAQSAVYLTTVQADGSLAGWQAVNPLPVAVYFQESVVHDGRLLVLGGRTNTTEYSNVYAALINSDGTLNSWRPEPDLPESINRFAAVKVTRNSSDYLYILGGLHGADYRAAVYHSSYPAPPTSTPTPTPTPTLTPTPQPASFFEVTLQNAPQRWIAPGEEIEYTLHYHNRSTNDFIAVEIVNSVPANVELLPASIDNGDAANSTYTGTQPGATIKWSFASIPPDGAGEVSFRVRRPTPTPPVVPRVLAIGVSGPSVAGAGADIAYTVQITNNTAFAVTNLMVVAALPAGATHIAGGDSVSESGQIGWLAPELAGDSSAEFEFVVHAERSLVFYDYYVSSDEGPTAKGQQVIFTQIDDTAPLSPGDGVWIENRGALATWQVNGQSASTASNAVFNPSYGLHLPLVSLE